MAQQEAAIAEISGWLSHARELGKEPAIIECTKSFEYLDMTYYIFRFKAEIQGTDWLIGVCGGYVADSLRHCGHLFSRFEAYNAETEEQDAIRNIETVRSFWMEMVKQMKPGSD